MAGPTNPNQFQPPTPQQLKQHLDRHPPARATSWQSRMPQFMFVAAAILMLLVLIAPALVFLPALGLIGLMAYLASRARAAQVLAQQVTRAWELAMIRRYREALGRAWELLPNCKTDPELHGRVVTIIAHILAELGQDDSAEVAYEYLLDRLPADHPLSLRLRVQRAVAALNSDRLADADDALRRLRGQAETSDDPALAASYRLAKLLQDVRTGHFTDAVTDADKTADQLRPLGVEAGYGHGLLALSYHQLAQHDPHGNDEQRRHWSELARNWWDKATLLIPAAALLHRFPDLRPLPEQIEGDA